jgi:hypothetical protein
VAVGAAVALGFALRRHAPVGGPEGGVADTDTTGWETAGGTSLEPDPTLPPTDATSEPSVPPAESPTSPVPEPATTAPDGDATPGSPGTPPPAGPSVLDDGAGDGAPPATPTTPGSTSATDPAFPSPATPEPAPPPPAEPSGAEPDEMPGVTPSGETPETAAPLAGGRPTGAGPEAYPEEAPFPAEPPESAPGTPAGEEPPPSEALPPEDPHAGAPPALRGDDDRHDPEPAGARPPLVDRPIPDVLGLPRPEAQSRLRQAGFEPRVLERGGSPALGLVIRQDPCPGSPARGGERVELAIGTPQGDGRVVAVPDVSGLALRDAVTALLGKGFLPLPVPATARGGEGDGRVVRTSPPAGAAARTGGVVRVEVPTSLSDAPVDVPSVVGLARSEASERLSFAGFAAQELIVVRVTPGVFRWENGSVLAQWPSGRVAPSAAPHVTMWIAASE